MGDWKPDNFDSSRIARARVSGRASGWTTGPCRSAFSGSPCPRQFLHATTILPTIGKRLGRLVHRDRRRGFGRVTGGVVARSFDSQPGAAARQNHLDAQRPDRHERAASGRTSHRTPVARPWRRHPRRQHAPARLRRRDIEHTRWFDQNENLQTEESVPRDHVVYVEMKTY